MIDYIIFGLVFSSFIFVALSMLFVIKEVEFEDKRLKSGMGSLVMGLVFLAVFLLSKSLEYFVGFFGTDITFVVAIIELVCLSFMALFFLVGMVVMREI